MRDRKAVVTMKWVLGLSTLTTVLMNLVSDSRWIKILTIFVIISYIITIYALRKIEMKHK